MTHITLCSIAVYYAVKSCQGDRLYIVPYFRFYGLQQTSALREDEEKWGSV